MRSVALLVVLVACGGGGESPPPDAPPTLTYRLSVFNAEPPERPPAVFIDGVAAIEIDRGYPAFAAAAADTHRVELRFGSTVVATRDVSPSNGCPTEGTIVRYEQSICLFGSGDLRFGSEQVETSTG